MMMHNTAAFKLESFLRNKIRAKNQVGIKKTYRHEKQVVKHHPAH